MWMFVPLLRVHYCIFEAGTKSQTPPPTPLSYHVSSLQEANQLQYKSEANYDTLPHKG